MDDRNIHGGRGRVQTSDDTRSHLLGVFDQRLCHQYDTICPQPDSLRVSSLFNLRTSPYDHHPTEGLTPYATTHYAHYQRNRFVIQHGIQHYYTYTNYDNEEITFQPSFFLFQTHDSLSLPSCLLTTGQPHPERFDVHLFPKTNTNPQCPHIAFLLYLTPKARLLIFMHFSLITRKLDTKLRTMIDRILSHKNCPAEWPTHENVLYVYAVSSSLENVRFPNKDKNEARIGKAKTSTVNDSRRGETGKEINRTKQMQGNKSMDNRSERKCFLFGHLLFICLLLRTRKHQVGKPEGRH